MQIMASPSHDLLIFGLSFLVIIHGCLAEELATEAEAEAAASYRELGAKYLTESMIQPAGSEPKSCSARVFEKRAEMAANNQGSVGVEPTVGLAMALVIFIIVGVFAALIAYAFQLVGF